MKHYRMTFSAFCAALGTVFLSVGFFTQFAAAFWIFLGSLCVLLSLETGKIQYAILTYFVIVVLSLLFNGFNIVFLIPFVCFMGLCPMTYFEFTKFKLPKLLAYVIRQIWFIGSMIASAFFTTVFFGFNIDNLDLEGLKTLGIITAICIPAFFFYNMGMINFRIKFKLLLNYLKIKF